MATAIVSHANDYSFGTEEHHDKEAVTRVAKLLASRLLSNVVPPSMFSPKKSRYLLMFNHAEPTRKASVQLMAQEFASEIIANVEQAGEETVAEADDVAAQVAERIRSSVVSFAANESEHMDRGEVQEFADDVCHSWCRLFGGCLRNYS